MLNIQCSDSDFGVQWLKPDWPAPDGVVACSSLRLGGVSEGLYQSLNLAAHVDDDLDHVLENRTRLQQALALPVEPVWLQQVHGVSVINAADRKAGVVADASWTDTANIVCAILTADCLPVLLCRRDGSRVAAIHAGWRGLADGVIEAACEAMACPADELLVWLGPAIGAQAFEVGGEVRETFLAHDADASSAFQATRDGHWNADLYRLARQRLQRCGVNAVYGGGFCTFSDSEHFFSHRRDAETGVNTGRMATLIWLS